MTTSPEPVSRFDHITIVGASITVVRHDYAALLGFAPTWQGAHPELGTESALFGLQNAMIELTAPRAEAEESEGLRDWIATTGGGLQALAFGTDDAAACSKTLRERGVRATPPQAGEAHDDSGASRTYQAVDLSPRATRGIPVLIVERPDFSSLTSSQTSDPAAVHALDHVVIRTASIDAAKALYGNALGVRLALERDLHGTRMLFFRVGGVTLEVVEDTRATDADAFYGAAYRVHDIAAAHQRLTQASFDVSDVRVGHKPGTSVFSVRSRTHGVATLFLHDPARP